MPLNDPYARPFRAAALALVAMLAAQPIAVAQDKTPSPQPQAGRPVAQTSPETLAWIAKCQQPINLNFVGGTLNEYVSALQAAAPVPVNVVMSPEAGALKIGSVRMHQATVLTAMEAIRWAVVDAEGYEAEWRTLDTQNDVPRSSLSYAVNVSRRNLPKGTPAPGAHTSVRSFAIGELLEAPPDLLGGKVLKLDDVLHAVEAAMRLPKFGATPPEILMHKESGLLVVQGAPEQVALVGEVVQQLGQSVDTARSQSRAKAMAEAAAAAREKDWQNRSTQVQAMLREATERRDRLQADVEPRLKAASRTPAEQAELDRQLSALKLAEHECDWAEAQLHSLRNERFLSPAERASAGELADLRRQIDQFRWEIESLKQHH